MIFLLSLPLPPPIFPGLPLPGTQRSPSDFQVLTLNCDSWKPLGLGMETHRTQGQACTGRLCLGPGLPPPPRQARTYRAAVWPACFAAEIGGSQTGKRLLTVQLISQGEENRGEGPQGFPQITCLARGQAGPGPRSPAAQPPVTPGEKPDGSEAWTDSSLPWRPSNLALVTKITTARTIIASV